MQVRWRPEGLVETLRVGQRIRRDDGSVLVTSVGAGRGTLSVIDLTVRGTETFFATGIACNDKKG